MMTIDDGRALPSGPFELGHRSLQSGLRAWVERQTRHPLGYVEQLYTFADSDRRGAADGAASDLDQLSRPDARRSARPGAARRRGGRWYDYFPWEDHRAGAPALIESTIAPALSAGRSSGRPDRSAKRRARNRLRPRRTHAGTRNSCCSATSFYTRPR